MMGDTGATTVGRVPNSARARRMLERGVVIMAVIDLGRNCGSIERERYP